MLGGLCGLVCKVERFVEQCWGVSCAPEVLVSQYKAVFLYRGGSDVRN